VLPRLRTSLQASLSALSLVRYAIVRLGCAAFRDMLRLAARPLEPAALTLRSRYQLPGDIIVGWSTLTIPTGASPSALGFARAPGLTPIPLRHRAPGCPIGTHPRALRDFVRGCSWPYALSLPLSGRPLIPAALTLRSRYQLPGEIFSVNRSFGVSRSDLWPSPKHPFH